MFIDFLTETFREHQDKQAIIWKDGIYNYEWLISRINYWGDFVKSINLRSGDVTMLDGDFSPNSVALLLALIDHGVIIVPMARAITRSQEELIETAQGEKSIVIDSDDKVSHRNLGRVADNRLYRELRKLRHPGLVLFSSGSTGKTKAAVHDFAKLLEKYRTRRRDLRTMTFLLFDHIGGIDTLFYSLSNGSCIITVEDRSPDSVCAAIQKYNVEVLPVTPTFLNLLLLSEAYSRYDLSTLKFITYGTEVMPESTLKRCHEIFPQATILQKYGTTEVGTLRSKSRSSDSLWVKIGGEGYRIRVVEGILQIKADSAMLGYLNAPSPFTEDGWFNTGDEVESDGEYIRILGRKSEIINVGGEKVYPAEVENVIQEMDNVSEVTVYGEANAIVGNIVCARVGLIHEEDHRDFINRLKKYCRSKLQNFKVPVKVEIIGDPQHSERFKKKRPIRRSNE
jgi:long-chain acyl-CoA synthetase